MAGVERRSLIIFFAAAAAIVPVAFLAAPGSAETDFHSVERGKYLVTAGDCVACHTTEGSKPMSGGRAIATPFGTIYSANITPDREHGIGGWSKDQFYRAMHEGISAGGKRLYPAFPYPYYTHVTRQDSDAIYDYLMSLEPVGAVPPSNDLAFPLDERAVMRVWNWMFFKDSTFQPAADKSAEWNRGAYLVEGLGHCGACHTPKNWLGADNTKAAYRGSNLQDWFAPSLGSDLKGGLGAWSQADVFDYLKTGRNRHSNATGPMAEVVRNSTSKMTDSDVRAMSVYLKDLPGGGGGAAAGAPSPPAVDRSVLQAGQAVYEDQCAACHRTNGTGEPGYFPPLKGNANLEQPDATTVLRLILQGARSVPTDQRPTPLSMPAFDWKLSDAQIAAVASYVRSAWGNGGTPISANEVTKLRRTLENNVSGN